MISSINLNKRGVVLILTLATILVVLALVMGLLLVTNLRHRKASQELSSSLSSEIAESAVDQQILFADANNWNIDWDNNKGTLNATPPGPPDVGIPAVNQWQNNSGTPFPKIVWMKDATTPDFVTATYADYTAGGKSAIYNFNGNKNLFIDTASGQNQPYRAVLEWDSTTVPVNAQAPIDVSYMGMATGEGSVKISGSTNRCIVRKVVKVLPEAFNHHVIYAQTLTTNATSLPTNLSTPAYTNKIDGINTANQRLIKLDLPGTPSPYFDNPTFPRIINPPGVTSAPPINDGILYFAVSTTIAGPTTIKGTVIVNGNLTLDSTLGTITIMTAYNTTTHYIVSEKIIEEPRVYPAIICRGNIILKGGNLITIAGLVYTNPSTYDFTIDVTNPPTTINGTIIARTVTLQSNTTLSWNQAVFDYPAPFFLEPALATLNNATNPTGNDLRLFGDEGKRWVYKR